MSFSSANDGQRKGPITEEEEKIMREEQEERENPEVVQHDREYDEYKDGTSFDCLFPALDSTLAFRSPPWLGKYQKQGMIWRGRPLYGSIVQP